MNANDGPDAVASFGNRDVSALRSPSQSTSSATQWFQAVDSTIRRGCISHLDKDGATSTMRIGLFDNDETTRLAVREMLSRHKDMEIVCEGANGRLAISAIRAHSLDVVVLDLSLPDLSGIDALHQLKNSRLGTAFLIVSALSEDQYGPPLLKAGAKGFVSRANACHVLVRAIRTVAAGRRYITQTLADILVSRVIDDDGQPRHARLSARELQLLSKLATGCSVSDIAQDLCLSPTTVSSYRTNLFNKMQFKNNADLELYAVRHALLDR